MAIHPLSQRLELLPDELMHILRVVIYGVRDEWADPLSSTSYGVLSTGGGSTDQDQAFAEGVNRLFRLLVLITVSRGLGTAGLQRLFQAFKRADAEARQINPSRYDWHPDCLDVMAVKPPEGDGRGEDSVEMILTYESNQVLLEDWVYAVLFAMDDFLWLLDKDDQSEGVQTYRGLLAEAADEHETDEATEDPPERDEWPPARQIHLDVVRGVTPTNGPNRAARAIDSSVRACGDSLAA